jgi:hypothetical protein
MIDCYCDYDYHYPEFCYSKIRKARRSHKCTECSRIISVGEKYEYVFGKWEGETNTFKTCSDCYDIRMFVKNSVPCFCWAYGNVEGDALDAVEGAYYRAGEEVKGLAFGLGRLIVKRNRRKYAESR